MTDAVQHISFSSFKDWKTCPYYFKLTRIDKLKQFSQTIFTEFGVAMHETLEKALEGSISDDPEVMKVYFQDAFHKLLTAFPEDKAPPISDVKQFVEQGLKIIPNVIPSLRDKFGDFTVVRAEEELYEDVGFDSPLKFKGYIDLVIKTSDGKYHIIDWKTASWGWDVKKKSDPMVTYQLTYYKHYFAAKHNVEPKNIETYFGILKRTAKDNPVEMYRVTSGPRKTNNALKMLEECVYNVGKQNHVKNKLSCTRCEFYRTKHCP